MINYRPLLALLERVMAINTMPTPCLMVYPFKSLINFHDEIEAEFRRMSINVKQETEVDPAPTDATETTTKFQSTEKESPEQVDSTALLNSIRCLVTDFMHKYLHDLLDIRNKIASVSLDAIAFADLWQLFRPGTTVIQNGNPVSHHKQQAYRIFHVEGPFSGVPSGVPDEDITLYCYSLAYDGVTFRPGETIFHVAPYHGLRNIRYLSVLPVRRYIGRTETMYEMPDEYIDDEIFVDFEMGVLSTALIAHIEPGPSRSSLHNLMLPEDHKVILTAIVNYCKPKNTDSLSEDITAGTATDSGQGLVVLLHGPPGSGKSNAVKRIARSARPPRPVYHLKGGVPPSEPEKFANCLKRDLQLASRWGCVVLFDDAEVFLSERADDLNKNRLVCMFLSIIDDIKSVLFLTTNRVGLIDEALKTRIHIALAFPQLSEPATELVWRDQIDQGRENYGPSVLTFHMRHVLMHLRRQSHRSANKGSSPWNVRQIQNAFHASVVLAAEDSRTSLAKGTSSSDEQVAGEEPPGGRIGLKVEHLTKVSKLRDAFESYLAECRGNDEERAFEFSLRADNFEADPLSYNEPATSRAPSQARRARFVSPPPKSRHTKRHSKITSSEEDEDSDVEESESEKQVGLDGR
ncbi:hypothetical protein N8I77_013248 [Diaporthe amygdali]|uniref:AAA+ ATPase domain-containing protein n=1 Tax=Phomopsis amygdali TaxID=1214568 RepID=A0AAD9S255_PHOAM|nr:hypothetical protein N8I77_013248 [Diaporthe amygdali]